MCVCWVYFCWADCCIDLHQFASNKMLQEVRDHKRNVFFRFENVGRTPFYPPLEEEF